MKKKMKGGSFMEPSKRLKFGDVISGSTKSKKGEAGEIEAARKEIYQSMAEADAKELGKHAEWKKYNTSKDTQKFRDAADAYEAEQKKKREAGTTSGIPGTGRPNTQGTARPSATSRPSTSTPKRKASTPTAKPPMAKAAPLQRKETKSVEGPAVKKQGVQTKSAPSTSSTKSASSEGSGNKRIDRIKRRAEKKVSRIENRRGRRENIKQTKNEARAMIRNAKGKPAKMQQGDFKDTSTNVDFGKPSEMSPKDARKNARAQTKAANKQYRKNVKAGLEKPVTPAIGNIRKKGGLIDRRKRK